MEMSSLTVKIQPKLKSQVQKKAQQDGVTLTFIINQMLKAYNDGGLNFGLVSHNIPNQTTEEAFAEEENNLTGYDTPEALFKALGS